MRDNTSSSTIEPSPGQSSAEEWIFLALLSLAALIVMVELLSLYSTPVPDSYLWWGDESWLMIEFRTQILTGIFQHPYALGSSLAHGSGIVFDNMWVPAILYGIPAVLISPQTMDIVLLGRTVTAVLAFTLLLVLFAIVRKLTQDRLLALFSIVLLVTSRSFLFTSHSARYDILSSLAIMVGIYVLLRIVEQPLRHWHAALVGFVLAATLLITIHVTLALSLATLATMIYRGKKDKWMGTPALFVIGGILFLVLLVGITALRSRPVFGSLGGAFALNIHDIPGLRLFSRSVQLANLLQRWHQFVEFGLGYIIVCSALVLFLVIQMVRKPSALQIGRRAILLFLVFVCWFELESAAPTSYLIYVLPVLGLVAVLALEQLLPLTIRTWAIAALSVVLAFIALRDMPGPHGKGYELMSENYEAVGTALSQIEDADSNFHPLVLTFNPAVHEVLRDTNVRLMTTNFVEFPGGQHSVASVLHAHHVDYALVYLSAIKPDYMREVGPILSALDTIGTPLWERPGYFTDIGRSYFDRSLGAPDTLRLYKLHE